MHPHRRRKKRPNYGIRTVEVDRGANGFGFTISGQQPCILSCIVSNSPADLAGLRAGDFLISVNGLSVSKVTHDAVVKLIGNSVGPIRMSIAEYYYSDSSDDESPDNFVVRSKPRYPHKSKVNRTYKRECNSIVNVDNTVKHTAKLKSNCLNKSANLSIQPETIFDKCHEVCRVPTTSYEVQKSVPTVAQSPIIQNGGHKFIIGYLGTIEMPNQLAPATRNHTINSCIRKLRHEKRPPTTVAMNVMPSCITLTNVNEQTLAIYSAGRIVCIGSSAEKESSSFFGLVTATTLEFRYNSCSYKNNENDKLTDLNISLHPQADLKRDLNVSNSCHVFVTDSKSVDHAVHFSKAAAFNVVCTKDSTSGICQEFPRNCESIITLVRKMYNLAQSPNYDISEHVGFKMQEIINDQVIANSPQPSASSNSDSGIGFRDESMLVSDRILVVDFPAQLPLPIMTPSAQRPVAIDGHNLAFESLEEINNSHVESAKNVKLKYQQDGCISQSLDDTARDSVLNIRAREYSEPKCKSPNYLWQSSRDSTNETLSQTQTEDFSYNSSSTCDDRLTVRAMPDPVGVSNVHNLSQELKKDTDTQKNETLDPVKSISFDNIFNKKELDDIHFKCPDPQTVIFKTPIYDKRFKNHCKSAKQDKKQDAIMSYKLSPKVYGLPKPNLSYEELNTFTSEPRLCIDKSVCYGSLQDLCGASCNRNLSAVSEPDVRIKRNVEDICGSNNKLENKKGPSTWATGFEKLLEDAKGYETFSEFLKKEFSAENIHFWTSCEKYKKIDSVTERAKEAQCIYSRHLCKGALEPVNVDSQARNITPDALHKADTQLFVHAQKQIFNLMKFDSYPRFLKSDLYKECLADEEAEQCHKEQINDSAVKSKLKKSLSNAEDRRRKSLLPWHRKNRSKSKDRSEPEFIQPEIPQENEDQSEKDRYSSRSSLTSWDLTMSNSQDDTKSLGESSTGNCAINKNNLCRVILSDGATTVVQIRQNETVKQMVNRLLDKRGLSYSNYEVYISTESKAIDISKDSAFLAGCEVLIQTRVVFKLDLPNRKVVSVRSKPTKILSDVLRPILHKFGYKLELVHVLELPGKEKFVDISVPVTSVDGCRLLIQFNENAVSDTSIPIATHNNSGQSLDELTNKVFEEVLQEKAHTNRRMRSDQGSMKSEDWGSEHSSGIFGRLLRRDSTNPDKRNKKSVPSARSKGSSAHGSVEDIGSDSSIKKPLIAKWKAGVKLHIAASKSESDELYEGLKRAQRQRLEDQRGTEINFELPDFLKDKENVQQNAKKVKKRSDNITSELTSRFYDIDTGNITPSKIKQHIQHFDRFGMPIESKSSNESSRVSLHLNSPTKSQLTKFSDDSPSKSSSCSNVSSRSSGMSLESTMIENTMFKHENKTESRSPSRNTPTILNGDSSEPPPLPPKPKVLPIKPSNWKKMPTVKQNDVRQKPTMYLDQPASSFV